MSTPKLSCLFGAMMLGAVMGYMVRERMVMQTGGEPGDPIVLLPKGMEKKARRAVRNIKRTLDDWS